MTRVVESDLCYVPVTSSAHLLFHHVRYNHYQGSGRWKRCRRESFVVEMVTMIGDLDYNITKHSERT